MEKQAQNKAYLASLKPLFQLRTAIFGVGAALRMDDHAGVAAIEALKAAGVESERLLLVEGGSAPENLTGVIRSFDPDALIVIDAAELGLAPGEYRVLDPKKIAGATFCTHMLPLPVTLHYLEQTCGCVSAYIGIQPASTEQGIGMCAEVENGVEGMVREITDMVRGG